MRPQHRGSTVQCGDRGSEHVSGCYTERLTGAGIKPPVDRDSDRHNSARARTTNGRLDPDEIQR